MHVSYRGGRYTDPSFDASAMLHPLPYYQYRPSSLAQYEANNSTDQPGHHGPHAARAAAHRTGRHNNHQSQSKKAAAAAAAAKPKSPLALLQADQAALRQRKANIARFGCTWLRPAGVPKTYQAMMDEAAEREEQEAQARRDAALAEEQRAARQAEAQAQAAAAAVAVGGTPGAAGARRTTNAGARDFDGEGAMEVDLDDEVPDAEEVEYDDEEDEDHGEEDDDDDDGATREEERDLDGSIPEAGSYQHTDTDVEDEESISFSISEHLARNPGVESGVPPENALNPPQILDGATGRFVHSIEGTADFMPVESPETSMLMSSPADARERALQRQEEFLARRGL